MAEKERAEAVAEEVVIAACREIVANGDEYVVLALKVNADVFVRHFGEALRSYAAERADPLA
jgi:hypothetical protein